MLSFLRPRYRGYLHAVYKISVNCAHRSSAGGGRRRPQQLESGQRNEELGSEMLEYVEETEDFHDWIETNVAKPEFQKIVASEEEKLRRKVVRKIIERKFYKKPQEVGLLTWDAKEQIHFLHNEYPDEWTVDRLAASFPVSREGVIKILKSSFRPKSLAEILKHDERVQEHWKELQGDKKKQMLASGPVTSRYRELLKNAAGNPSLPRPDLNQLLLPTEKEQRRTDKTFTFLSIVKDYCEKKQGVADADAVKQVKSKQPDETNFLETQAQNRKLIGGVVEKSPKHLAEHRKSIKPMVEQSPKYLAQNRKPIVGVIEQPPTYSKGKRSGLYKTLESEKHSVDVQLNTSARQNTIECSKQLIDTDFELGLPENDSNEDENFFELQSPGRDRGLRRRSVHVNGTEEETNLMDGGMQGTKKLGVSEDVLKKMEANSHLSLEFEKSVSKHAVGAKVKEALQNMKDENSKRGPEVYMFNDQKGYQHPFGQRKDLPDEKIPVPRDKLKSGVEFRKDNDFYDEDGEFLYRVP